MIVVPVGAVNPEPPEKVTSPDGILTATVDKGHAGVLLEAVWPGVSVSDDFTSGMDGWTPHGDVTLAVVDGALQVTETTIGSSGADWALPETVPAGRVVVRYSWSSAVPVDATAVRVILLDADGNGIGTVDTDCRGGYGGVGWVASAATQTDVAGVQIYLIGHVDAPRVFTIDDVTVETEQPEWVRFERGQDLVASGDLARAVDGMAVAYDHQAPLGVAVAWQAVPVYADGTEGAPSQQVALLLPAPTDSTAWVKSTVDPGLSMLLRVDVPEVEWTTASTTTLQQVPGSSLQAGAIDERVEQGGVFVFHTDTPDDRRGLRALLNAAPLLFQPDPKMDVDEMFCLPGDATETYLLGGYDPRRHVAVALTPIARPPTADAALLIPGRSYDDVAGEVASYDELAAAYPTYRDVWQP